MNKELSLFVFAFIISRLFSQVTLIVETDTTSYVESQPIEIYITIINDNHDTLNILLPDSAPYYYYIDSTQYTMVSNPVILPLSINPFDHYTFSCFHTEYVSPGTHTLIGGLHYYFPDYIGGLQTIESDQIIFEVSVTINISNEMTLPKSIYVAQNYPNPLNPTTTIEYSLPQRSDIQITIYDLVGRKVTTLVSETQDAGYKSVQWDASNISSGMYFYQIMAGEFVWTRKMLVLK